MAELSRFIGYDASFLSKIRNGTKFPSKPQDFIEAISNFIALKYNEKEDKKSELKFTRTSCKQFKV